MMISFINWSNRILMSIFIGFIFMMFANKGMIMGVGAFAIILGHFQCLSALFISSRPNRKYEKEFKRYILLIGLFFLLAFVGGYFSNYKYLKGITAVIFLFVGIMPLLLIIYFTYIIETINSRLKI